MPNVEGLKELKAWGLSTDANIKMNAWLVVQAAPECGTTMCLAGKAASLARPKRWNAAVRKRSEWLRANGLPRGVLTAIDGDYIEEIAKEWLDLDWPDASQLFGSADLGGDNSGRMTWLEVIDELIERHS